MCVKWKPGMQESMKAVYSSAYMVVNDCCSISFRNSSYSIERWDTVQLTVSKSPISQSGENSRPRIICTQEVSLALSQHGIVNGFRKGLRRVLGEGGNNNKKQKTVDLSQDGCLWLRSIRTRMPSLVPAPSPWPRRVRRSVGGQRGRNKFLCDWLVPDFKHELAARSFSAVGWGAEGSGRPPRWGPGDPDKWVLGVARKGASGAGFVVGGRRPRLWAVASSRVVVEAGTYSPSFEGSPWAGGAGGLRGRWLGSGWLLSWRRVLWKAGGVFLRWWLEQGRSHPKEVALT